MKSKVIIVILVVVCIGLAIALFAVKNQGNQGGQPYAKDVNDSGSVLDFSNRLVAVNEQIAGLSQVNLALTNDLNLRHQQTTELSNNLAAITATLNNTKSTLLGRMVLLTNQVAELGAQIASRDRQIADLKAQNQLLDQQAAALTNNLMQLNRRIAITQEQLASSQTNNAFLQSELQKQLAEKAELERKFNDLDGLRAQVKKLKDEQFMARRLHLMKHDYWTGKKGGQLLMMRPPTKTFAQSHPDYDLNVEVGSDGSVKVIPPLGATNAAAR